MPSQLRPLISRGFMRWQMPAHATVRVTCDLQSADSPALYRPTAPAAGVVLVEPRFGETCTCWSRSLKLNTRINSRSTLLWLTHPHMISREFYPYIARLRAGVVALAALSVIVLPATLPAQQVVAPLTDDSIVMATFEVSVSGEEDGYVASETLTGSRVKERIIDLPYVVNVITREFLEDFAFFEVEEEFSYVSAFTGLEAGGNFQIRGLGATKSLRDGFQRFGLLDRATVDRIEIIKGPSAAVYGETRPGGLINVISRQPRDKPQVRLSANAGSYATRRYDFSATGPLGTGGRLFYDLSAGHLERGYDQPIASNQQSTGALALRYVVGPQTTVRFNTERLVRVGANLENLPLIDLGGAARPGKVIGIATEMRGIRQSGPEATLRRTVSQSFASLEHRINNTLLFRAAASYFDRYFLSNNGTYGGSLNPATRVVNRGAPSINNIWEDGGGFTADLLATYRTHDRRLEHRTLFTIDYSLYNRFDPIWQTPNPNNINTKYSLAWLRANGQLIDGNTNIDQPIQYALPAFTSPINNPQPNGDNVFTRLSRWRENQVVTMGGFLRHQTAAFQGRAIFAGSLRYDTVDYDLQNKLPAAIAGQGLTADPSRIVRDDYRISKLTPSGGFNVKARPNLAIYGNYAESFFPDSQTLTATGAADPAAINPPEGGFGYDYGLKYSSTDGSLSFTLGGFFIERTNLAVQVLNEDTNEMETVRIGTNRSEGLEFDMNWRVTANFSLMTGYGLVDSRLVDQGRDLDLEGRPSPRVPKHNAYLATRYNFTEGPLQGLRLNLGVRYTGSNFPLSTAPGIVGPDGYIRTNDGRRELKLPGYTLVDLGASYSWRMAGSGRRLNHTVSLNLKNAFDKTYMQSGRRPGDLRGLYAGYTLRY
jgi:iron complex outermembrane recepter protein